MVVRFAGIPRASLLSDSGANLLGNFLQRRVHRRLTLRDNQGEEVILGDVAICRCAATFLGSRLNRLANQKIHRLLYLRVGAGRQRGNGGGMLKLPSSLPS